MQYNDCIEPENPRKKPMKAGTGHGWFEILRLSGFPNPTRRSLEGRGFSREFLSRPENPKVVILFGISENFILFAKINA